MNANNHINLCNVDTFFNNTVSTKQFSKIVRRLLHVAVTLHLNDKEKLYEEWLKDGLFFVNEFLEVIDPLLED